MGTKRNPPPAPMNVPNAPTHSPRMTDTAATGSVMNFRRTIALTGVGRECAGGAVQCDRLGRAGNAVTRSPLRVVGAQPHDARPGTQEGRER